MTRQEQYKQKLLEAATKRDHDINHNDYASWEADAKKLGYHITHHTSNVDPNHKWSVANKVERDDPKQGYENMRGGPPFNRSRGTFWHNGYGRPHGYLRYKYMPTNEELSEGLHLHTLITHHHQIQTLGKHIGHQLHGTHVTLKRAARLRKIQKERSAKKMKAESTILEAKEDLAAAYVRIHNAHAKEQKVAFKKYGARMWSMDDAHELKPHNEAALRKNIPSMINRETGAKGWHAYHPEIPHPLTVLDSHPEVRADKKKYTALKREVSSIHKKHQKQWHEHLLTHGIKPRTKLQEDVPVMSSGTGGFSGSAAAAGPVAGYDAIGFRNRIKARAKKGLGVNPVGQNRVIIPLGGSRIQS